MWVAKTEFFETLTACTTYDAVVGSIGSTSSSAREARAQDSEKVRKSLGTQKDLSISVVDSLVWSLEVGALPYVAKRLCAAQQGMVFRVLRLKQGIQF